MVIAAEITRMSAAMAERVRDESCDVVATGD